MSWKELRHNGVAFPPPYEPRRLSIRIHGKTVQLSPEAEELAYAWGKKRTTPYIQDPVFQDNFLSDFLKLLPTNYASTRYSEMDFAPLYEFQSKEELQRQDGLADVVQRVVLSKQFRYHRASEETKEE